MSLQASIDFNTGYSYLTSLPAFFKNKEGKACHERDIYLMICRLSEQGKEISAKMIEHELIKQGKRLSDGRIAARLNSLKKRNLIAYDGLIEYDGMKRKKIILQTIQQ